MTSLRHVIKGLLAVLVVVTVLLAQGGTALACVPSDAASAADYPAETGNAPQPMVPCDHDGIACCMNGACQTIAGWPTMPAEAASPSASTLTRYHAVRASLSDGLVNAPAPPPPRLQVWSTDEAGSEV